MAKYRLLLLPFSLIYGLVLYIRNFLYDMEIIKSYRPPLPVICIGNLAMGGTGKTPHTEYLIRLLKRRHKLATLSRGYGRNTDGFAYVNVDSNATATGDEPLQFARKFGNEVVVAVDENRKQGIIHLLADHRDLDIILLDDAFQHRRVSAGLNILLSDYSSPYFRDFVLPAGNLREQRGGVKRAHIVILTKCPQNLSEEEREGVRRKVPVHELFFSHIRYSNLRKLSDDSETPFPDSLSGILLLSGIANNKPLAEYLQTKTNQLRILGFPDHHNYSSADLDKIKASFDSMSEKNNIIVTSEKDAMRLRQPEIQAIIHQLPVYYVPIRIEFNEDDTFRFQKLIFRYVNQNKKRG
jgi:tetraacyldisaccharide 4'-kinase